MQITSTPSLDTFLAARPLSQAPRGNGDNESFARMMQQRQDQSVPAPQPVPRQPAADTSDATYDMSKRQATSTSDAKASSDGATTRSASSGTSGSTSATQTATDTRTLSARRAEAAKLGKHGQADGGVAKTDSDSTTDPIKNDDATPGTSPADWAAQWAGLTPRQAPVTEPADGAASADTATATPPAAGTTVRTPLTDTPPIALADGKQATIGIISPNDPRTPVGTPVSQDDNPISLTPTADTGVKPDKSSPIKSTDMPSPLEMLQSGVMDTVVAKAEQSAASTTEPVANSDANASVGAAAAVAGATLAPQHTNETTSVQIATPVHAPEFKEALGVQVSMMAKDGVQHAQLHLNPSDMGPISVQIATEGTQARVDFGADSAATRQILEAGLPELASALQSAGLTLTGGGVSQHAQGGSQGNSDSRDGSRGSRTVTLGVEGASTLGASTVARTQRGNLDLYA